MRRLVGMFRLRLKKWRIEVKHGCHTKYLFDQKNIHIGDQTYGLPEVFFSSGENELHIGKFCSIAEGVRIMMGGMHHGEWVSTYPFYHELPGLCRWNAPDTSPPGAWGDAPQLDTRIGNDVWIGRDVLILPGVAIGNGAIIGARAVVSRDIPAYCVAAGVPARVIRKRFTDDQIDWLERIQWWNWNFEKIQRELPHICSGDIDAFIERNS